MEKNKVISDTNIIKQGQGLVYQGKVTAISSTTGVTVASLSGFGNDFFCPASYADWEMYHAWDAGGAGAAPQGLLARVNDYVSTTGAFTITAFVSGTAAVGDIVMLIHPVLAWLGTKADAAATGAVATTTVLSSYIKQILNELLGTDGGWTNMTGSATASLDVALQKLAAILNIDGSNAFSVAIDGQTASTDLDSLFTNLVTQLGTRASAAAAGAVTTSDNLFGYVKQLVTDLIALRGGTETLESLDDELDAMIDMAKDVDTTTITTVGTQETLTGLGATNTNPMYISGIWLGLANLAAGDIMIYSLFADWDDASIADQITSDHAWTFGGVQTPNWVYRPLGFWVTYEIAVKVNQLAGATQRAIYTVLDIGQRGS